MIEDDARAQLERMVAFDSAPELTPDDIDALLNFCNISDDSWALELGAAEGWRWKAGKVAGKYSFSIDGQTSDQGQVHRFCLAQADLYDSKAGGFAIVRLTSPYTEDPEAEVPDPG